MALITLLESDNINCDVKVLTSNEGHVSILVSSYRYIIDDNMPRPPIYEEDTGGWISYYENLDEWKKNAKKIMLNSRFAGKALIHLEIKDAIEILKNLKEEGFLIPNWIFEELEIERENYEHSKIF